MKKKPELSDEATVVGVRAFNRFYTRVIGLLDSDQGVGAPMTLTQARLLYELAHRDDLTAAGLVADLALDPGYLSRLLRGFESQGLIRRLPSAQDARVKQLKLTAAGRRQSSALRDLAQARIGALIAPLDATQRARLLGAMTDIRALLGGPVDGDGSPPGPRKPAVILRPHRAGDIGWVIERHAAIYQSEYGWNSEFEALVADIGARFLRRFDPACERGFIAEIGDAGDGHPGHPDHPIQPSGRRVGCAFVMRGSATVARLRLVLVEPEARGLGLGHRLVDEAISFARASGYRTLTLWTNDCLHAARAIYMAAGFRLVDSEPHQSFGQSLVGQRWTLPLTAPSGTGKARRPARRH